jgi:hypothetical protein
MFTIDLLNGNAVPPKSRPGGIAIVGVTAVIPVLAAISILSLYLQNKTVLSMKEHEVTKWENKVGTLSDVMEWQSSMQKQKTMHNKCLSEIRSSITKHTQWSDALSTIVKSIPETVILNRLEIKKHFIKKKIPKKDNPDAMTEIDIPVRTLQINVTGNLDPNCVHAIQDFGNQLRTSASLGPKLDNITYSQESDTLNGQDVINYEINCVFKPGL